ncbi:hypothetical protein BDB01DRAFT_849992 [Pilobolus umbonatus]|nr:hypothetical protein BDB01DRAFT_849992 [Pilobolus umbonatus]
MFPKLLYHCPVSWIIEPSKRSDMPVEEHKVTRSADVSFLYLPLKVEELLLN